ncbi:MAG TPA: hypothetical protein VMT18_07415 [Planctomycetota bacterium]|nr:hypothetical protein [Planctomycetota bacterium]
MEGRIPIQIEIHSRPEGASAYVVSETLWRPAGEEYFAKSQQSGQLDPWFDAYRVKSGRTPVKTSTSMGILHLIVAKDGHFEHSEVVPSRMEPDPDTGHYRFTVEIPELARDEVAADTGPEE